ncbi:hypothetical protein KPH14_012892, partial [Odynerus spinipes]
MAETPRVIISKLNNENYISWKYKLELLLIKEGLWDVVNENRPPEPDNAWLVRDGKAKATIGLLVEDDQLIHIRNAASARAAWIALKDYHEKSSLSTKFNKRFGKQTGCRLTVSLVKGKLIDEYRRRGNNLEPDEKVLKTEDGGSSKKPSHVNTYECFFCKKKGHRKKQCYRYQAWKQKNERANKVTDDNAYCFNVKSETKNEGAWYIDSGATSHMTNDKEFFTKLETDFKDKVYLANGKNLEVKVKGTGKLNCITDSNKEKIITVEDVLYVPDLCESLLSVRRIQAKGCEVNFKNDTCNIIKNKEIIAVGDCIGNLYKLRTNYKSLLTQGKHNKNCIHSWHRKLGHRDPDVIQVMAGKGLVNNMVIENCYIKETCETCIEGKSARKPFPKKSSRETKDILDLVHSDICGPMQTITPRGKRRKLDKKAKKLCFVGCSEESKAFRLLDKETNKITISRDVVFLENKEIQEEQQEVSIGNYGTSETTVDLASKEKEYEGNEIEETENIRNQILNAFLNGELDEEIYMQQPAGYEVNHGKKKLVLRLRKSIFGLKQSANNWNKRITKELEILGYKR